jgi:peptide/nickel transport system ATP-binding protein
MEEILNIENLCVEAKLPDGDYKPIVKGINFKVNRGEVVALIGESGSGKSTISLSALGYVRPGCHISEGRVFLDGVDILSLDTEGRRQLRGKKISYVAQSAAAAFNPSIRIGDQVTEAPVHIHRMLSQIEANKRAVELYHRLDLPYPESISRRYPHQVSGGQLQRLMAAMALSCNPSLLVLDEPTTALDVTTQIEVLMAFKEIIKHQNTAAIYVTHDLAVVTQIADRIIVLCDGEVQERGTTDHIVNHPEHHYTKKLMNATRPAPKATLDSGSDPAQEDSDKESPAIEVKSITAGYGGKRPKIILRDINMVVPKGQVVGVIGESGCGKSTLARVISGLLPQVSGEVMLNGKLLPATVKQRSKEDLQRIQIVFQIPDVALNPRHRVRDILGRPLDFYMGMNRSKREQRVAELLEMVELPPHYESRYPGELSGGEKQRINLARALAAEPEVILCDEVISSLDTVVGAAVIELMKQLQERLNLTNVFISHDLSTVASFADRILVLYAGRMVESGTTQHVLSPPYHPYTRLLLSSVPEMRQGWLEDVMTTREAMTGIAKGIETADIGCPFFNRCPLAIDGVCDKENPPLQNPTAEHLITCHRESAELTQGFENI